MKVWDKFEQQGLQVIAALHGVTEVWHCDTLRAAGGLHVSRVRRAIVAHHDGEPGHALGPDNADLDLLVVLGDGNHGGDTLFHKIDVPYRLVGLFAHMPDLHRKGRQMRIQQVEIAGRKRRKKLVLMRGR